MILLWLSSIVKRVITIKKILFIIGSIEIYLSIQIPIILSKNEIV